MALANTFQLHAIQQNSSFHSCTIDSHCPSWISGLGSTVPLFTAYMTQPSVGQYPRLSIIPTFSYDVCYLEMLGNGAGLTMS